MTAVRARRESLLGTLALSYALLAWAQPVLAGASL